MRYKNRQEKRTSLSLLHSRVVLLQGSTDLLLLVMDQEMRSKRVGNFVHQDVLEEGLKLDFLDLLGLQDLVGNRQKDALELALLDVLDDNQLGAGNLDGRLVVGQVVGGRHGDSNVSARVELVDSDNGRRVETLGLVELIDGQLVLHILKTARKLSQDSRRGKITGMQVELIGSADREHLVRVVLSKAKGTQLNGQLISGPCDCVEIEKRAWENFKRIKHTS